MALFQLKQTKESAEVFQFFPPSPWITYKSFACKNSDVLCI